MPSFYEEVEGVRMHYEKVGNGPQVLLMIPGAVGCTRSDFPPQLDGGLDQSLFTIIAVDCPGYGKSRPPDRMYSVDSYPNDARKAAGLMDKLGYKLYSILGWSDGAKVALLIAINHQARVDKLIVWGVVPVATDYDVKAVSMTRDINIFDPEEKKLYYGAYGEELFKQLWFKHVDYCVSFSGNPSAIWDIRKEMRNIKCPTLIIHGDKDSLIDKTHPYTAEREIADSRLIRIPTGSHNVHKTHAKEFNKYVTDFLLE